MLEKILKKISRFALAAGMAIGLSSCFYPEPNPLEPVVLAIDDFQPYWIEDVQDYLAQKHQESNIPVTFGVIPSMIQYDYDGRYTSRIKNWDSIYVIDVAQHGYDHLHYLEEEDYNSQYELISNGKNLMEGIGVFPKTFVPSFGSSDDTTINILNELKFHSVYCAPPTGFTPVDNPIILIHPLSLWENGGSGKDTILKDYSKLDSEIKEQLRERDFALIVYHIQDFESEDGTANTEKIDQIINLETALRNQGYDLMNVDQYYLYKKGYR